MKWGFIGCGKLAQSIISGSLASKILRPNEIIAANRTKSKITSYARKTKIKIARSNIDLVKTSEIIVLATKPQDIVAVLDEISNIVKPHQTIVSLCAGVSIKSVQKYLKTESIVRVMANTPAQIRKGVFGVYPSKAHARHLRKIKNVLSSIGSTILLKKEAEIDLVLAAGSSGVGFVFAFMEIYENWLSKRKLNKTHAHQIVTETFLGGALLAQKQNQSFKALKDAVTSKKGTTLAGLKSMSKDGVNQKIERALTAAMKRSREISKKLL